MIATARTTQKHERSIVCQLPHQVGLVYVHHALTDIRENVCTPIGYCLVISICSNFWGKDSDFSRECQTSNGFFQQFILYSSEKREKHLGSSHKFVNFAH